MYSYVRGLKILSKTCLFGSLVPLWACGPDAMVEPTLHASDQQPVAGLKDVVPHDLGAQQDASHALDLPSPTHATPGFRSIGQLSSEDCRWDRVEPFGVTLEDLDGDGRVDILEPRCDALHLHFASDEGYDTEGITGLAWASEAYTYDMDDDGLPEIIWPGAQGVEILKNQGQRLFSTWDMGIDFCASCGTPEGETGEMSIHNINMFDADGDGDDDMLIGGFSFGALLQASPEGGLMLPEYALPAELWLRDGDRFTQDTSFPTTRGFTLHSLVEPIEGGMRIYILNDFANTHHDIPEYDQLGSSTVVEGGPGAWQETRFRDVMLQVESPMGGWLRDFDGDGHRDMVASRAGGYYAYKRTDEGLYDVCDVWSLPGFRRGVTWSILPFDPWHDGRPAFFASSGGWSELDFQMGEGVLSTNDLKDSVHVWSEGRFHVDTSLFTSTVVNARAAIGGDLDGDGRPDLVMRGLAGDTATAALHLYADEGGGGNVVELRFEGCRPLGARIQSSLYDEVFMPYQHSGTFGNGPTDRMTVPLGELSEDEVRITFADGTSQVLHVDANSRVFVSCQ